MKRQILDLLKNLYEDSEEILFVLDAQWKSIWKNRQYLDDEEQELLELIVLPENFWGKIQKKIYWNDTCFLCKIICNQEEAYRLIRMKPIHYAQAVAFDEMAIRQGVHAIRAVTNFSRRNLKYIEENLEQVQEEPEDCMASLAQQDLCLRTIDENLYLLCRDTFIHRMLCNVERKKESKSIFEAYTELEEILYAVSCILENYMEITMHIMQGTKIFLRENREFFCACILAGILICCDKPDYKQRLVVETTNEENMEIFIFVIPQKTERDDRVMQGATSYYKSLANEMLLLDLLCSRHDGNWCMMTEKTAEGNRKCCKIWLKPDIEAGLGMCGPKKSLRKGFFGVYSMMLSRIFTEHETEP